MRLSPVVVKSLRKRTVPSKSACDQNRLPSQIVTGGSRNIPGAEAVSMCTRPAVPLAVTRFIHENSLSLVFGALFLLTAVGQLVAGFYAYNDDALQHRQSAITLVEYAGSGHFLEALFENWESEFLQMALFIVLTAHLHQKGSAESKKPAQDEPHDEDPRRHRADRDAPWAVRRGGWVLDLYEHSLSIAVFALFAVSLALHAAYGLRNINEERLAHGDSAMAWPAYLSSSQFWFESLQNWQSEFFSLLAIIILSIVLREKGSTQSKRVAAQHAETGS